MNEFVLVLDCINTLVLLCHSVYKIKSSENDRYERVELSQM